jgi:hypothetical protein
VQLPPLLFRELHVNETPRSGRQHLKRAHKQTERVRAEGGRPEVRRFVSQCPKLNSEIHV